VNKTKQIPVNRDLLFSPNLTLQLSIIGDEHVRLRKDHEIKLSYRTHVGVDVFLKSAYPRARCFAGFTWSLMVGITNFRDPENG
jgi:hypothetical protein